MVCVLKIPRKKSKPQSKKQHDRKIPPPPLPHPAAAAAAAMSKKLPSASGTFQPLRHRSGTMRDRLHNYTKRTLGAGGSVNDAVSVPRGEPRRVGVRGVFARPWERDDAVGGTPAEVSPSPFPHPFSLSSRTPKLQTQ